MNIAGVRVGGARRSSGGRKPRPTKAQILAQHWRLRPGIFYISMTTDNDSINLIVKGEELTFQRMNRIADGLIDENTAAISRAFQSFVMKWDIMGDDGKPLPLTKSGIERLGIPMIFGMTVAIANALEIPAKSLDHALFNRATGKPIAVSVSTTAHGQPAPNRTDVPRMQQRDDQPSRLSEGPKKSKPVAFMLWILLGLFGGHRYYLGRTGSGILMTLTIGGLGLWWLIDLFRLSGMVDRRNSELHS